MMFTLVGIYAIDLRARGTRPGGEAIERTAFLSVEAQPQAFSWDRVWLPLTGVSLVLASGDLIAASAIRRRRVRRAS